MQATLKKVLLKVVNDSTRREEWTHISYADANLYSLFLETKHCETWEFADFIARWAKEDFNATLVMSKKTDIEILKHLIKDYYKKAFPYLYIESPTDRQGWVRVWLTKKMKEELGIHGRESF